MFMQLLDGVLVALAVLVSAAIAVSLAMLAAASVTRPGQASYGGIRPDPPQHPQLAAGPAAPAASQPGPPRWTTSPQPAPARTITTAQPRVDVRPQPPRELLRTRILPARLPHTIQLCIHCQDRPAGFWVSRTGGQTVRRPWCLSCCQGLDRDRYDVIRFDP